jgi:LacI family transcriptional regulator
MKRKMTAKEISEKTGISASTISRVINHPELVNENTRNQVMNKLKLIGYTHPKSKHTSKLIGITISNPLSSFAQSIAGTFSKLFSEKGYQIVQFNIGDRQNLSHFFSKNLGYLKMIDALIITSAEIDQKDRELFEKYNVPIVLLQTKCKGELSIHNNNFTGCQNAAKYMISRGYEKIAFIGWTPSDEHINDRYMGFSTTLQANNTPIKSEFHVEAELSAIGGYSATEKIMSNTCTPDAIFYGCDEMASGGLKYLTDKGYKVPDDIGIMGFDNLKIAHLINLTTMDQSIEEKCSIATKYLLERLSNTPLSYSRDEVSITPKLIERSSLK